MKTSPYHYHSTMNDFLKLQFAQLKKESSTIPNPQKETSDLKAGYVDAQCRCFTYKLTQVPEKRLLHRQALGTHHKFDC